MRKLNFKPFSNGWKEAPQRRTGLWEFVKGHSELLIAGKHSSKINSTKDVEVRGEQLLVGDSLINEDTRIRGRDERLCYKRNGVN